jgi:SAM-dependent methyltransferase
MNQTARMTRDVAVDVAKNLAMAIPLVRKWRLSRSRTVATFDGSDRKLERFAFDALDHLLRLHGPLSGLAIAEIGPGDFLTSGIAMLAAGAASYTAIERFVGDYRGAAAKEWYRGIERRWPAVYRDMPWPAGLSGASFPENCDGRVEVVDQPFETYRPVRRFDVVCSFQVGEHLSDIEVFAQLHGRILAPSGLAVHRVDFAPHDRWEAYPDPLTFLRTPDWLWTCMGSHRGCPNRRRHHEFLQAFEAAGLTVVKAELQRFEPSRIERSKLSRRFREMPQDSLSVASAIYVCRASGAPAA